MLGGTEGSLAPTSPITHLSVLFFILPHPPLCIHPPPSVCPPPPGATRPRSNGDPRSGPPRTVPGCQGHWDREGTGIAGGGGGTRIGETLGGGRKPQPPPVHFVSLQGLAPCRGATGCPCSLHMINRSPFAQQRVLFRKYMKIQKNEFITHFPHCANPPSPPGCQPPPMQVLPTPLCQPLHYGANSPRWGARGGGIS